MELNNVTISGYLTRDTELKYSPSGTAVCSFAIGHNKTYVSNGEKVSEANFFYVNSFGKLAETVSTYLKKGSGVIVEGSLKQETLETNEGQKREKVRIIARKIHFMPRTKISNEEPTEEPTEESHFQDAQQEGDWQ